MPDKEWGLRARINAYAASGTTAPQESSVMDMLGFESIMAIGIATVTSTAQQLTFNEGTASTTGAGNFSEVVGDTSHTTTGGLVLDQYRPTKRFVQARMTASGASAPARGLVVIRYGARSLPSTQDASGAVVTQLYSAGSGTATG